MRVFFLIWFGQVISLIGSELTSFSLGIWVYQKTGSNTQFSLILLFASLPFALLSPFAGMYVDRWNRFWTMVISDFGASFCTLGMILFILVDHLETWHIYLATALISVCATFQVPAYITLSTLLVPKNQLTRASGMVQLGESIGRVVAPILAGFLIISIQLKGILILDYITFLLAMVMVWSVRFVAIKDNNYPKKREKSLTRELLQGWNYIVERRGLLALLIFLGTTNFIVAPVFALTTPLILSFASPPTLGIILSLSGAGMLLGGIAISIWGGSQRIINTMLGFTGLAGVFVFCMGLRPSVDLVGLSTFLAYSCQPFFLACSRAIFQKKTPLHLQGRVFACYNTFLALSLPFSYAIAGPLADKLFEPLMANDGPLSSTIGTIMGVGPGRGIGLLFSVIGLITILIVFIAYCYRPLRLVEKELPDRLST